MTAIDERKSVDGIAFDLRTYIDMYLRARTTGTDVAHLPEIVFFIAVDNTFFWQKLLPHCGSFVVARETVFFRAFENGYVQPVFIEFYNLCQELPSPRYSLFLEVIAKRPVAQHLEHRMVVCVVSDLLEVIMFPTDTQTFLSICHTRVFYRVVAEYYILKLVHTRIGKHQSRVVFDDHRSRWNYFMLFVSKKIEKSLSCLFGVHFENLKIL